MSSPCEVQFTLGRLARIRYVCSNQALISFNIINRDWNLSIFGIWGCRINITFESTSLDYVLAEDVSGRETRSRSANESGKLFDLIELLPKNGSLLKPSQFVTIPLEKPDDILFSLWGYQNDPSIFQVNYVRGRVAAWEGWRARSGLIGAEIQCFRGRRSSP